MVKKPKPALPDVEPDEQYRVKLSRPVVGANGLLIRPTSDLVVKGKAIEGFGDAVASIEKV